MRSFDEIWDISAKRKGGEAALIEQLQFPKSNSDISNTPDDRFLAQMTKGIFQAGFNWKVVENMWPGFEAAFDGFDIFKCRMLHEEDFDRLVSDTRIVRHGTKIRSVQQNASFIFDVIQEHGSFGKFLADWPADNYIGLLDVLKKRGSRLGGNSGAYFLRFSGVDGFILSQSVTTRLIAEGIVDKAPTSKKALAATQEAFNKWREESGRSLTEISRVLAMSND